MGSYGDRYWTLDSTAPTPFVLTGYDNNGPVGITVTGQQAVLVAREWVHTSGTRYLLVGSIDANDVFSLHRYHDVTGDELPDASTQTLLFDSGGAPMYVTDMSRPGTSDRLFLLDRRCQDILVATDSDADGWPDHIEPTPFARSDDHSELLDIRIVLALSDDEIEAPESRRFFVELDKHKARTANVAFVSLKDTTSDGVADTQGTNDYRDLHPRMLGMPYNGQTTVKVSGTPGQVAEVWSVDAFGVPTALLGSATILAGPWTSLTVTPPLPQGSVVRIAYRNRVNDGWDRGVWAAHPQVHSLDRDYIRKGGGTITLEGVNFFAGMTVTLYTRSLCAYTRTLAVTVTSTETAVAIVPALAEEDLGQGVIAVTSPTQPPVDGAPGRIFAILPPPAE